MAIYIIPSFQVHFSMGKSHEEFWNEWFFPCFFLMEIMTNKQADDETIHLKKKNTLKRLMMASNQMLQSTPKKDDFQVICPFSRLFAHSIQVICPFSAPPPKKKTSEVDPGKMNSWSFKSVMGRWMVGLDDFPDFNWGDF